MACSSQSMVLNIILKFQTFRRELTTNISYQLSPFIITQLLIKKYKNTFFFANLANNIFVLKISSSKEDFK